MDELTRRCWKCGETKILDEFHKDSTDRIQKQKICKTCARIRARKYASENREYFKQKNREHYEKQDNAERYQKYKESYKKRIDQVRATVRGRLYGIFSVARQRAKKKGLPFDITLEWLLEQFDQQEGKCALTGITLTMERNPNGERFYMPFSPSLDQVVPNGGYTMENTRIVCVAVNLALNRFGEAVLEQVARGFLAKRP